MKCPLLAIAWSGVVAKQQEEYPDCIQSACAWWDTFSNQCAIWAIGRAVNLHGVWLEKLVEKMPHEKQLRK